ncbi:MAG: TVP38/TMEM64 family protein [Candidatus Helarchaeota archaeon]
MSEQETNDTNSSVKKREESIYNFSDMKRLKRSTKLYLIAFIIIIVVMVLIYAYNFLIDDTFLPRIVLEWVIIPLRNIGIWGIFIFFGLMVIQSIIAPIPSEMVLLASGLVWGLVFGAVIGFLGSMISAFIGYYIAYRGGRPVAIGILGEKTTTSMEYYMSKYGIILVAGMRAIPIVPYDLFTIASGFTQMDLKRYTLATGVGTIPRVFFYSWIGTTLAADVDDFINQLYPGGVYDPSAWAHFENTLYSSQFNMWLLIIFCAVGIGFLVFYLVIFPHMKKGYEKIEAERTDAEKNVPANFHPKTNSTFYPPFFYPPRFKKDGMK